MTTATASLTISCPPWCITPAQEHADDLWNMAGKCVHVTDFDSMDAASTPSNKPSTSQASCCRWSRSTARPHRIRRKTSSSACAPSPPRPRPR